MNPGPRSHTASLDTDGESEDLPTAVDKGKDTWSEWAEEKPHLEADVPQAQRHRETDQMTIRTQREEIQHLRAEVARLQRKSITQILHMPKLQHLTLKLKPQLKLSRPGWRRPRASWPRTSTFSRRRRNGRRRRKVGPRMRSRDWRTSVSLFARSWQKAPRLWRW